MLGVLFAAAVATAPAGAAPPAVKAADPIVCRQEPIEGSRITRKVCQRASEAQRQRQDARQMLDRMQGATVMPMSAMGPMH